jgi:hypothetical protein
MYSCSRFRDCTCITAATYISAISSRFPSLHYCSQARHHPHQFVTISMYKFTIRRELASGSTQYNKEATSRTIVSTAFSSENTFTEEARLYLPKCGCNLIYIAVNAFLATFLSPDPAGMTLITLKRTVFDSGLHCPTMTVSPSLTRKQGDTWADSIECRFSYR